MANCTLHQIFLGEVASVQNYGAFIRIPGSSQQGLIHKSQVSTTHVDDVGDILQRGDRVWCKVISIGDDNKIALSMKYVNQGSGKDLDPNGVDQQRDAQRKKVMGGRPQKKAIQLEAVLNTTCTKCGTPGHLSKDCFMSPDGKKYELLPEVEEIAVPQQEAIPENDQEKEKKPKKVKKKKKSKKHEQDSDQNDSDSGREKKKKKRKHSSKDEKKKKKKRKHDSSSSDEASSSSSSHDIKAHKRKSSESSERSTKKHKHSRHK